VLRHFPTKQALVQAVLDRELDQQVGHMSEMIEPGGLEALKRFSAWGSVVEETPELASLQIVMSAEGVLAGSPIHDYVLQRYTKVHDLVVGLIREGIQRGEIRADVDAEWEACALVAYLDGIRLQWFYSGRRLPLGRTVQRYFALMIDRLVA
jgi:AcrR family transcriptional regulator